MNDEFIDQLLRQVARNICRAKTYLAQGATTDARRHAARAESLLTVLAHARLVCAASQFPTASQSSQ